MFKQINRFGLLMIAAASLYSCTSKDGYETDKSGLMYKMIEDKEGTPAKEGDIITLSMVYKTSKDSVLFDTKKMGKPLEFILPPSSFMGSLEFGLAKLSAGDSAAFQVNADSLFEKTFRAKRPDFVEENSKITFNVRMINVQSKEQFEKAQAEKKNLQVATDDKLITDYLTANGIKAVKNELGIYYSVSVPGKGNTPNTGDTISVNYTGKFLDGKVFDSSQNMGKPLEFPVGYGFVIKGWDEGLKMLKAGEKGTLFIPSGLAYGPTGAGGVIPPNAVLIFDVELLKVKPGKK